VSAIGEREARVPEIRIRQRNDASIRSGGDYVLYWMIAHRRTRHNFSLQRAVEHARELGKPLLVLEALRCDYRWASDRFHRFVLDGMHDNRQAFANHGVAYHPYVEPTKGAGSGLLDALGRRAAVVVTDDFPCFFLPRMVAAMAGRLDVLLEDVDTNGLYPMRATDRVFTVAHSMRRFLQKELPDHLGHFPLVEPLEKIEGPERTPADLLPDDVLERWPAAEDRLIDRSHEDTDSALAELPIDHDVGVVETVGGPDEAFDTLDRFLSHKLSRYAEERNAPDEEVQSFLSPYLHFGHVSAHEVFRALAAREDWDQGCLAAKPNGKREGWWGMSEPAEAFLDELVTWREIGYNMTSHRDDYDRYESLPDWARETLGEHESDERKHVYSLEEFETASTHDDLWNAAQNQLVQEGRIHNYLRMLWGKKVLEWTPTPRDALDILVELNNKYALDGRNPNSYSGIFWVLGRYDRAWGPERKIFGKIRYMTSKNTAKKVPVADYLARYS